MKFDCIKEIVLNEETIEDTKNYTIKSFPKKENINNFIFRSGKKNATSLEWHMNCHNYILTI